MAIRKELLDELIRECDKPRDMLGPDDLLKQLSGAPVERILEAEMTGHPGHEKNDPTGRGSGNSRNGRSKKTLKTDRCEVEIEVPRDREQGLPGDKHMNHPIDPHHLNRRDLLGAAGLAATGGALGLPALGHVQAAVGGQPSITIAGYKFDRTVGLADGRVAIEGFDHTFEPDTIGAMNTHVFSGPGTRDVTEIGLHPFMLAHANDGFRDYALLPVFPLRLFRHKSIFIGTDRGIKEPADLRGRKVGTPGFSSTSLTWLRGIMEHEYGLKPTDIEWVISAKDSSADLGGKASKQESMVPEGLSVSEGPAGKDESQLLVDGDVDALFHAVEPKAYVEGNPKVARLFPDFRSTERAYYVKTGIFPIMHAVAIRRDAVEKHPELPMAVCAAYSEAKRLAFDALRKTAWVDISLPWIAQEIEETRKAMGDNYWPYGIKDNLKALNALFEYSHEQGLAKKRLSIEDLFHPAALKFEEKPR